MGCTSKTCGVVGASTVELDGCDDDELRAVHKGLVSPQNAIELEGCDDDEFGAVSKGLASPQNGDENQSCQPVQVDDSHQPHQES